MSFRKAERTRARLRMLIDGPAKSGKTTTALRLAVVLGGRIAVADAEQGKAALCVGDGWDGIKCEFDHHVMTEFSPMEYGAIVKQAAAGGYGVLMIDGLSPAWEGIGGCLEMVDEGTDRNEFARWKAPSRAHRRMLDDILNYPGHVICTVRSKISYVIDTDKNGKQKPRKIGLAPVQRAGLEYEFDLLVSMDSDHFCTVSGSRCDAIDGATGHKPGKAFWLPLLQWLETGQAESTPAAKILMAGDAQVKEIHQLWIDLNMSQKAERARLMRRWNVDQLHQLTFEQAENLLGELRFDRDEQAKAAGAAAIPGPQSASSGGSEVGQPPGSQTLQEALADQQVGGDQPPVNGQVLDRDALLEKLAAVREDYYGFCTLPDQNTPEGKAARKELWQKILTKQGVTSATQLAPQKLAELVERIEKRVAELSDQQRQSNPSCAAPTAGGSPSADKKSH